MQRSGKYKQGGLLIRRTNQSGKCRVKGKDDISKEHEVISALSLDKRETVKSEPMTNVEVNLEPSEPDETSEPESDERSVLDSDVPPSSPFNPDDFFSLNKNI
ncbi:uncharacterized protein [Clytia hemisphaerica]|uniref:uncharacterized protein n=1 Tax=Clytia hemisphaerica TaxID=252671 RepID=UPI0034D696AF